MTSATSGLIASYSRFFAWRDVAMRYKQTVIGVAWSPFLMTAVFGRVAKLPSSGGEGWLGAYRRLDLSLLITKVI
jgi:hypothetical protein